MSLSPNLSILGTPGEYKSYEERHDRMLVPEDLMNHDDIIEIAKDKWKSRSLQRSLMEHDPIMTELIYQKALPVFHQLLNDQYGNYLSQKILEHCGDVQFNAVFDFIKDDFFRLANEVHGTRAVQKFVEEAVRRNRTDAVVDVLRPNLEQLSRSITGFHVIVKLLEKLPTLKCEEILEVICKDSKSVVELGLDQWGCCVLKTCVDVAQKERAVLIKDAIIESSLRLIQDPYGNYVVQHLLQTDTKQHVLPRMIEKLKGHMLELCQQKFSSNVLEKLLITASKENCNILINCIIHSEDKDDPKLRKADGEVIETLLFHQYGNYVLQQLLCVAKDPMYSQIIDKVRPCVHEVLRNSCQHGCEAKNSFAKKYPTGLAIEQANRLALKLVKRFPTLIDGLEDNIRHIIMSPPHAWDYHEWNAYDWTNQSNTMYNNGYTPNMWDSAYYWQSQMKYPNNPGPAFPANGHGFNNNFHSNFNNHNVPLIKSKRKVPSNYGVSNAAVAALQHTVAAQSGVEENIVPKHTDGQVVGRVVGYWPNYTIQYDAESAAA